MATFTPPGPCPVCGEDVPPRARACPDCGACRESGWKSEDAHDPDEAFDYEEFVAREFGQGAGRRRRQPLPLFWWGAALIVFLAMLYLLVSPLLHFR